MTISSQLVVEKSSNPILQILIKKDPLAWFKDMDWEAAVARFYHPNITLPSYYKNQNFHGIEGGYLNIRAAISYDPICKCLLAPNETLIRQDAIAAIQGQPRRILDLGCGTGSTTLMLKQAFPQAEVIGIDLSPYMLAVAANKAQQAGLEIQFLHGNAEQTEFSDAFFNLVTASMLFHETPSTVSKAILRESYRLLRKGGEVVILDGNQQSLRQVSWVDRIFEEPYINDYATGSIDAWLGAAGFETVQTHIVWWIHQVSRGMKIF